PGNTRGHDVGSQLYLKDGTSLLGGCWWEKFDESPRDVAAWVSFAAGLDLGGVALVGHSLGAQKVVYYQAQRQDPRVRGVIAASGPMRRGRGIKPETLALAGRMVAEGRAEALLPIDPWLDEFPPPKPGPVSAQTFLSYARFDLDVFGVDTPEPAVAKIRCPLFACYGTEEPEMATAPDLDIIRRTARASSRVDTRMFDGADHSYTGHEQTVGAAFAAWLDTLP
ncbi:MAG: alpha/beta fold hydrolase, partial [Armatimonadetes bacterium]|nr:alpha/beta fold hydrolase [Armatimonadota bacterium]